MRQKPTVFPGATPRDWSVDRPPWRRHRRLAGAAGLSVLQREYAENASRTRDTSTSSRNSCARH